MKDEDMMEMKDEFVSFKILSNTGREGVITIGKISEKCGIDLYIKRLIIGNDVFVSDELPPVKASIQHRVSRTKIYKYPFLHFKIDNKEKILELTNHKLIEYIWKQTGKGWDSVIYKYTENYVANWCD